MTPFLLNLLWILVLVQLVPTAYLLVLTIGGLFRRKINPSDEVTPNRKFAVLVPAHNEEKLIASTVTALRQSHYPNEMLDIIVIADNCDDDTALIARAAGATVLERTDTENRGKGQALDWALREYADRLRDASYITVVDADTLVDPLYFREVNHNFHYDDVSVIQGYYGVSNIESNWRTGLSEIAFAVSHHLRPLGRNVIGGTAGLKGNGMSFHSSLLLEIGWPAHSVVEDLELTVILLKRGIQVKYVPGAKIAAEMVTRGSAATTQRMRWEGGRGKVVAKYAPTLLYDAIFKLRFAALECLLDLLFPPLAMFLFGSLALLGGSVLLGVDFLIAMALTPFVVVGSHVVLAMLHRGVPLSAWKALLSVPLFLTWKLCVYAKMAVAGSGGAWIRTLREGESEEAEAARTRQGRFLKLVEAGSVPDSSTIEKAKARDERRRRRWQILVRIMEVLKRGMDIAGAITAILLLSPVLLMTAFLIYLEDRGPIFFFQERVGKKGKPFQMVKFRSMRTDAEKLRTELDEENEHDIAITFKIKRDPRITRIGRFIRKFSIDEMPQFYNVLKGDMSLVGPRPALAKEVALYKGFQLRRLDVKPGLSCLWQIQGRSDIDFEGQARLDLEYIHSESLWKDIVILVKTLPAVILARGAY